jgi:hypothetical protein
MSRGRKADLSASPKLPSPIENLDQNDLIYLEGVCAVTRKEIEQVRNSMPERSQQRNFLDFILKSELDLIRMYAQRATLARREAMQRHRSGAHGSSAASVPAIESESD